MQCKLFLRSTGSGNTNCSEFVSAARDPMYECDHGFVGQDGVCVPYMDMAPMPANRKIPVDIPPIPVDAPAKAPKEAPPVAEATPEEDMAPDAAPMPTGEDCESALDLVAAQPDLSTLGTAVEVRPCLDES